jgi:hypothetical protein
MIVLSIVMPIFQLVTELVSGDAIICCRRHGAPEGAFRRQR